MGKVVNISQCFKMFSDTFSPKIIGELNGQYILVVRCEGDKVPWHTHLEKDKKVTVNSGEFYIVSRGTEHRVVPQGLVKLMLFEPTGIAHTGEVRTEITKKKFDRLDV